MIAATPTPFEGITFDAVIFDLDGTLIDSHVAMNRSYEAWAGEYNISLDRLSALLGMPSAAVSAALVPPKDAESAARRIELLEVNDTEGVVPLSGALKALQDLPRTRVAIATSCSEALMRARMAAAGLPFPDVIVTRDQVVSGNLLRTVSLWPPSVWVWSLPVRWLLRMHRLELKRPAPLGVSFWESPPRRTLTNFSRTPWWPTYQG